MENDEGDMTLLRRLDEADVAQCASVGDSNPALTSIRLTDASVELTVSKIRIWSGT